jgi:hypothetical membrane protein
MNYGDVTRRTAAVLGLVAPPLAAAVVLIGGLVTPGYDPFRRTVSRLAEPGLPAATYVDLSILLVGVALLGLGVALAPGGRFGRGLLWLAGAGLIVAAAIHLDPASELMTGLHRLGSTVAMLGLAGTPLALARTFRRRPGWGGYGPLSFGLGAAAVAVLLIGLALLPTTFPVGVWERCFLGLTLGWVVVVSARLLRASSSDPMFSSTLDKTSWRKRVSAEDTMNTIAATSRSHRS